MVWLDERAGSKELAPYIGPHTLCLLPYGDLMWMGNGEDGPVPIAVEYKSIADLVGCAPD